MERISFSKYISDKLKNAWALGLLVSLLSLAGYKAIHQNLKSNREIQEVATVLSQTLATPSYFFDGFEVEQRLKVLSAFPGIISVLVHDTSGRLLASFPTGNSINDISCNKLTKKEIIAGDKVVGTFCLRMKYTHIYRESLSELLLLLSLFTAIGYLIINILQKNLFLSGSSIQDIITNLERNNFKNTKRINYFEETHTIFEAIESYRKRLIEYQRKEQHFLIQEKLAALATNLAHDIRSPLSALKSLTPSLKGAHKSTLSNIIDRITNIADDLLLKEGRSKNQSDNKLIDVNKALQEIVTEKRLVLSNSLTITENLCETPLSFIANKQIFMRIVSNLINNSVEAMNEQGTITISTFLEKELITIIISDEGSGFPQYILEQAGRIKITTKDSGHGIGLFTTIQAISSWGGSIDLNNIPSGAQVRIQLKLYRYNSILIDNDPLVRMVWENQAKQNGIQFATYESVDGFLSVQHEYDKDIVIYIDSNLADGVKGEIEAKKIYDAGFKMIILATGEENIENLPSYISKVIGKEAPWSEQS